MLMKIVSTYILQDIANHAGYPWVHPLLPSVPLPPFIRNPITPLPQSSHYPHFSVTPLPSFLRYSHSSVTLLPLFIRHPITSISPSPYYPYSSITLLPPFLRHCITPITQSPYYSITLLPPYSVTLLPLFLRHSITPIPPSPYYLLTPSPYYPHSYVTLLPPFLLHPITPCYHTCIAQVSLDLLAISWRELSQLFFTQLHSQSQCHNWLLTGPGDRVCLPVWFAVHI